MHQNIYANALLFWESSPDRITTPISPISDIWMWQYITKQTWESTSVLPGGTKRFKDTYDDVIFSISSILRDYNLLALKNASIQAAADENGLKIEAQSFTRETVSDLTGIEQFKCMSADELAQASAANAITNTMYQYACDLKSNLNSSQQNSIAASQTDGSPNPASPTDANALYIYSPFARNWS